MSFSSGTNIGGEGRPHDRLPQQAPIASDESILAASELDRRSSPRRPYDGTLLLIWHHRPSDPVRLHTIDVSEGGARVRTTCCLPDGMTGTAVELLGAPGQWSEPLSPEGASQVAAASETTSSTDEMPPPALERHLIGRTVTVVWSKAVRRDDGRLDHYEAGLRFF